MKPRQTTELPYRRVRLACNGDVVEIASILPIGFGESLFGALPIEFMCPRCSELHESLRFL